MKKKFIVVLLSALLVVASAITGVYAQSITDYPSLGVTFSQVVNNGSFIEFPASSLQAMSNNDSLMLFNDLYLVRISSNQFKFSYDNVLSPSNIYLNSGNTLYISADSTSFKYRVYNGTVTFGQSLPNTVQSLYLGNSLLTASDLGISFGSSFEIADSSVIDRFQFSLPYGNVLLISSESEFTINRRAYSISNTTYNYQKYVRASDDFSYRVNGSYQGVVENSNVVGTFGLNVFGSNDVMSLLIPWQPVNQNILGRASSYNYYNASPDPTAEVSVLSGQSFMIWYPYYANNQDTSKINETNMEVSIDIYHSAPITFTTFPITGSTASSGEDTYIQNTASTSSSGSSSQSSGGDGSIYVTFDNAPSAGGNHGQAPINDNNSILGVLSNLQNTLLGLFNKAIDGIHNLITLGSDFLQSVQIMFSWLPAELLIIITSGFVILLTIGVLKTLWR